MLYFNSEKLVICSFVLFAHVSLIILLQTEENNREISVDAPLINLVVLPKLTIPEIEEDISPSAVKPVAEFKKKVEKKRKEVRQNQDTEKISEVVEKVKEMTPAPTEYKNLKEFVPPNNSFTAPEPVEKAELLTPVIIQNVAYIDKSICTPKYPRISRKRGEKGKVLIKVVISSDGRSERVKVEKSSGYQRLDQAAVNAAKKCRFVAAKRNGRAVKGLATIPYNFIF